MLAGISNDKAATAAGPALLAPEEPGLRVFARGLGAPASAPRGALRSSGDPSRELPGGMSSSWQRPAGATTDTHEVAPGFREAARGGQCAGRPRLRRCPTRTWHRARGLQPRPAPGLLRLVGRAYGGVRKRRSRRQSERPEPRQLQRSQPGTPPAAMRVPEAQPAAAGQASLAELFSPSPSRRAEEVHAPESPR